MERQKHGLIYERIVCERWGVVKNKHGSAWDVEDYNGYPISIKSVQERGNVCLGDFGRVWNCNRDFLLVIGVWAKAPTSFKLDEDKYIKREMVIKMGIDNWKSYFSPNVEEYYKNMSSLLKSISNSREDDQRWKSEKSKLAKIYDEYNKPLIRPAPKRDHGTQKRLQAQISLNKFPTILANNKIEIDVKYE